MVNIFIYCYNFLFYNILIGINLIFIYCEKKGFLVGQNWQICPVYFMFFFSFGSRWMILYVLKVSPLSRLRVLRLWHKQWYSQLGAPQQSSEPNMPITVQVLCCFTGNDSQNAINKDWKCHKLDFIVCQGLTIWTSRTEGLSTEVCQKNFMVLINKIWRYKRSRLPICRPRDFQQMSGSVFAAHKTL